MTKDEALDLALEALENWKCVYSDEWDAFDEHAITAINQARSAPVQETPFQIGQRLRQEGKGISDLWGAVSSDADMPEAQRGFDTAAPVQEPVSMRMPKVGDRVVCIEDESLGTVVYLTAGGSPEIKFDDGSHGTYMLREFAELFGYTTPPAAQRQWVGLTDEEIEKTCVPLGAAMLSFTEVAQAIEAKLKEKNT
jgi:hypothetical protein